MDNDVLEQGVFLALQQSKYVMDPYPLYHRLRSRSPIYWDFIMGGWFLTRHADVRVALADQRLITKNAPFDISQLPPPLRNQVAPLVGMMEKGVFSNGGAEHER